MPTPAVPAHPSAAAGYRWRILALLFAATTINYMDRSVLGVLGPTLQYRVFHWSDQDYAMINVAFKAAYALGFLLMGMIADRLGTRVGYSIAIVTWSTFGILHAAVRPAFSLIGFSIARFGLGLGESGNFPSAVKTVAEWFPRSERALATGIFNAGSNVGAICAPLLIPLVVSPDGRHWQAAFLMTGVLSAVWVVCWLRMYRHPALHSRVSPEELAFITADSLVEPETGAPAAWTRLLGLRQTWAYSVVKLMDAVWWFYLFWGGKFLYDQFGLDIKHLALPLVAIYVLADAGSIGGGWLSSHWLKRGWSVNQARKVTMLICALCILPVMFATRVGTRFELGDAALARLASLPGASPVAERLRPMATQSFDTAREFLGRASELAGAADVRRWEAPLFDAARTDNRYWIAVLLIALAAAGHQAWSANVYTLASDVFPKRSVGSVTGIGSMMGALAGIAADIGLGRVLSLNGAAGYFFAFLVAGFSYIVALGVMHLLMPRMEPVTEV